LRISYAYGSDAIFAKVSCEDVRPVSFLGSIIADGNEEEVLGGSSPPPSFTPCATREKAKHDVVGAEVPVHT
jgi:hypothetical protein